VVIQVTEMVGVVDGLALELREVVDAVADLALIIIV
jgi:hypothetical protein